MLSKHGREIIKFDYFDLFAFSVYRLYFLSQLIPVKKKSAKFGNIYGFQESNYSLKEWSENL